MASLWLDRPTVPEHTLPVRTLPADQHCEVAIVGAGLTGLTLAVLLARAGVSVVVVEAACVGAGTTGHTTAKISLLQGTRLSTIAAKHPPRRCGTTSRRTARGRRGCCTTARSTTCVQTGRP